MHNNWKRFINVIQGDIRRLDQVVRFNSIPTLHHETVATHSFWVVTYALLIHRSLRKDPSDDKLERDILLAALTHDFAECITGDVVRTFKYSDVDLKKAIDKAEDQMVSQYFPEELKSIMHESSDAFRSSSGKYIKSVIKAADFASLFMFMNREWIRGNREIRPFLERMKDDLRRIAATSALGDWYDVELSRLYNTMSEEAMNEPEMRLV